MRTTRWLPPDPTVGAAGACACAPVDKASSEQRPSASRRSGADSTPIDYSESGARWLTLARTIQSGRAARTRSAWRPSSNPKDQTPRSGRCGRPYDAERATLEPATIAVADLEERQPAVGQLEVEAVARAASPWRPRLGEQCVDGRDFGPRPPFGLEPGLVVGALDVLAFALGLELGLARLLLGVQPFVSNLFAMDPLFVPKPLLLFLESSLAFFS